MEIGANKKDRRGVCEEEGFFLRFIAEGLCVIINRLLAGF